MFHVKHGKDKSMELKDTVNMMLSDDYKERFKGEYYQLLIRRNRLKDMLDRWEKDELSFTPNCSKTLLCTQLTQMELLLGSLMLRAKDEDIIL